MPSRFTCRCTVLETDGGNPLEAMQKYFPASSREARGTSSQERRTTGEEGGLGRRRWWPRRGGEANSLFCLQLGKHKEQHFVQWPEAKSNKRNRKRNCFSLASFNISEWGVTPPPFLERVVHLPLWLGNEEDPPSKVLPQQQQPRSLVNLSAYGRR